MKRPNILIFMTDQQRGDTLPPYGRAITPNMDKFCNEGLAFSQAYTVSPHCCPSRASFFSGLYPSQHGVWNNVSVGNALSKGLYEGVRLWSEDLFESGYNLHFHGKWHVSSLETPADRGFIYDGKKPLSTRESVPYPHHSPNPYEWEWYTTRSGQTQRIDGEIIRNGYPPYVHYGTSIEPTHDRTVVNHALHTLDTLELNKPWCLYVGTSGPHDPYFVPQHYLDMYDLDDIQLPDSYEDRMKDKPALYRKTRGMFDQLNNQEHREAIRHYLAYCTYEDALFGEVLDALDSRGEANHTMVIFLSDHGDYMAEHGLWCKGLPCFKGAYHIPLVMRWPEGLKDPGRTSDAFVNLTDLAPTLLEAVNCPSERFSGNSLMPFLRGEQPEYWRDAVFTQTNGNELYGIQRSIMTKKWKFVYNGFDYEELYDLQADPEETTNLFGRPEYDDIIQKLSIKLWSFAHDTGDVCINPYIMVGLAPHGPGISIKK